MGSFFSSIKNPFDFDSEENYYDKHCKCGNNAIYRCSIQENHQDIEKIYEKYPFMQEHWNGTCGYTYSYVSCDACIKDEYKYIFTSYPEGWRENIKFHVEYECAKILCNNL